MDTRPIFEDERQLVVFLAGLVHDPLDLSDLARAEVTPTEDGGMGSLKIHPRLPNSSLVMVSQAESEDSDGVSLSIALFVDSDGRPRELDIWKVDFTPLVRLPRPDMLRPVLANHRDKSLG